MLRLPSHNGTVMKRTLTLAMAASVLTGCASFTPAERNAEIAWQALNAVDAGQTVTIARRPWSYSEVGVPSRFVIGRQPTERKTEEYFAASAVAHYAVSAWLSREADSTGDSRWRWALRGWQAVSLAYSAYNVAHNASMGIPVFGSSRPGPVVVRATSSCQQQPAALDCRAVGSGPP